MFCRLSLKNIRDLKAKGQELGDPEQSALGKAVDKTDLIPTPRRGGEV